MAKKFNFKLESVLNLKNYKTKEAEDSLVQAVTIRQKKEVTIISQNNYLREINSTLKNKMSLQDIQTLHYHKKSVENDIKKLENEKNKILEIENLRRKNLSEAMKEEKVLEKLKDKKFNQYKEDLKKEENEFMDEIASRTKNDGDTW